MTRVSGPKTNSEHVGRWAWGPRNIRPFAWLDSPPLHARAHRPVADAASGTTTPGFRTASALVLMPCRLCARVLMMRLLLVGPRGYRGPQKRIEEHHTPQCAVHTNSDQPYTNYSQATPPPLSLALFIHTYASGHGSKETPRGPVAGTPRAAARAQQAGRS